MLVASWSHDGPSSKVSPRLAKASAKDEGAHEGAVFLEASSNEDVHKGAALLEASSYEGVHQELCLSRRVFTKALPLRAGS